MINRELCCRCNEKPACVHRGRRRIGNEIRRSWLTSCSLPHRVITTSYLAILGFFSPWHKRGVISCSAEYHTCLSIFLSLTTTPSLSFSLTPALDLLIIYLLTLNLGGAGASVSICFCHGRSILPRTASQARVARCRAVGNVIFRFRIS